MTTPSSTSIASVFIVEPDNQGWIIERLMRDIADALGARGVVTRIGPAQNYAGEEVIFNSRYLQPFCDPRARIASLFVTHIDDRLRERELRKILPQFDSFVCLSDHDAGFVAGLRGNDDGVVGIDLPARDLSVRPVQLGMFSAWYADGRKNESWITEYFADRSPEHRASFVFSFLGADWEPFLSRLAALDLNYHLIRYARSLPGEYQLYKEHLPRLDALFYLGFDGGAMSAYDAVSAGIDLIATNISYHRNLDDHATMLNTREDFFAALDALHSRVAARRAELARRSVEAYTDRLLSHWQALIAPPGQRQPTPRDASTKQNDADVVQEFRAHYKPLSYSRVRSALIRFLLLRFQRG